MVCGTRRIAAGGLNNRMKFLPPFLLCGFLLGCGRGGSVTPQAGPVTAANKLAKATTPQERFYALNKAAKESFVAGNTEDARKYAKELLATLPNYQGDWNYGNAHPGRQSRARPHRREGRSY